jgi:hypothetical protein
LANFNWRMKFKKQDFPNPKKIFMLRLQLWEKNTATANKGIAEGLLPIESVFRECAERNLGRASADEMESCFLPGLDPKDVERVPDADGGPDLVYPFRWSSPSPPPLPRHVLLSIVRFKFDSNVPGTVCSIRIKDFGLKTGVCCVL